MGFSKSIDKIRPHLLQYISSALPPFVQRQTGGIEDDTKPGVKNPAQSQSAATFRRTLDMRSGHPAEAVSTGACVAEVLKAPQREYARCTATLNAIS